MADRIGKTITQRQLSPGITKGWPIPLIVKKIAGAQKQALSKNTNGSTTVLITKAKRSCR